MAKVADHDVIKRLVILIADGRSHSRTLLRSMLLQFEVKKIYEVSDGAAALDAIITVNPDVMIVDWELPVLSALDVLRMIKSQTVNSNPDLPIIVLSSSGESAHVHEAIELGAPHFMVWPISPRMLQDRLIGIVREARKTARRHKRDGQHLTTAPAPALNAMPSAWDSPIES
jgi:two-component system chemotaxis response regulator CheY